MYMLRCGDGTLYTGYTADIGARVMRHTKGTAAKYTKGRGPFKLEYLQEFTNQGTAMRREIRIKKLSRARKEALIEAQEQDLLRK